MHKIIPEEGLSLLADDGLLHRDSEDSYKDFRIDYLEKGVSAYKKPLSSICWPRPLRKSYPVTIRSWRNTSSLTRILHISLLALCAVITSVIVTATIFPSYRHPPTRYTQLRKTIRQSISSGSGNHHNEKVFIAAALYDNDGQLLSGHWGRAVSALVDHLGPENVFLSIYANSNSTEALETFGSSLQCAHALTHEAQLNQNDLPQVIGPDGEEHVKRIAILAEVRNKALAPLEDSSSVAFSTQWDKLLYLNDVIFDPVDAVNLLFNTNVNDITGRAEYRAACAVDFINPFKFYDSYATRDLEGYTTGVPFYPWFTFAGEGTSRADVLSQTDAVRVKSCWGGMVAFEAKWFTLETSPLRFRSEPEIFWDASECCLIHADLADIAAPASNSQLGDDTGIYMNPYIRVAYSNAVLKWLPFTRRFERLYTPIHTIANWIAKRPAFNQRRTQQPGQEVVDQVWAWDDATVEAVVNGTLADLPNGMQGSYKEIRRVTQPGRFCGKNSLSYIRPKPDHGGKPWVTVPAPVSI